jgi:hypothetical protein
MGRGLLTFVRQNFLISGKFYVRLIFRSSAEFRFAFVCLSMCRRFNVVDGGLLSGTVTPRASR